MFDAATLLLRQNGLLDERWVQSTQYSRRLCIGNICFLLPWEDNFGVIFCALYALEVGK